MWIRDSRDELALASSRYSGTVRWARCTSPRHALTRSISARVVEHAHHYSILNFERVRISKDVPIVVLWKLLVLILVDFFEYFVQLDFYKIGDSWKFICFGTWEKMMKYRQMLNFDANPKMKISGKFRVKSFYSTNRFN